MIKEKENTSRLKGLQHMYSYPREQGGGDDSKSPGIDQAINECTSITILPVYWYIYFITFSILDMYPVTCQMHFVFQFSKGKETQRTTLITDQTLLSYTPRSTELPVYIVPYLHAKISRLTLRTFSILFSINVSTKL